MNDTPRTNGSPETGEGPDYLNREVEARLERRLAGMEAKIGRARASGMMSGMAFALAVAALGMMVWQTLADDGTRALTRLSAEEITLMDGDGAERGRLGTDDEGRAVLSLSDRDGRERIRMTVLGDGSPGITINDPDARPRAVLGYLPDGTTNLVFTDPGGSIRTLVGVGADGEPSMTVFEDTSEEETETPDP